LGAHAEWRADFREAIPLTRRAEATARENHDGLSELLALAFRSLAVIGLGEYAEAATVINEGLTMAREREVPWVGGRLTNTMGWLPQELGDFRRAVELDRESEALAKTLTNPNVEISALINVGYDHFHLGETDKALTVLQDSLVRVEKFGFGAHRWRWGMHLATCVAEISLAQGQPERALHQLEKVLATAQRTGSQKYLGKAHLMRGQIAAAAHDWARGEGDLREALAFARKIEYPNLIWRAAHALAAALAARAEAQRTTRAKGDEAHVLAVLASDTISSIAERAPDAALGRTFLAWTPVQTALDDLERVGRIGPAGRSLGFSREPARAVLTSPRPRTKVCLAFCRPRLLDGEAAPSTLHPVFRGGTRGENVRERHHQRREAHPRGRATAAP